MKIKNFTSVCFYLLIILSVNITAQERLVNYDESKVPPMNFLIRLFC
jgi:hypothetical protein